MVHNFVQKATITTKMHSPDCKINQTPYTLDVIYYLYQNSRVPMADPAGQSLNLSLVSKVDIGITECNQK